MKATAQALIIAIAHIAQTNENETSEDASIRALETISFILQRATSIEKQLLIEVVNEIILRPEMQQEEKYFYLSLLDNIGINTDEVE